MSQTVHSGPVRLTRVCLVARAPWPQGSNAQILGRVGSLPVIVHASPVEVCLDGCSEDGIPEVSPLVVGR